MRNRNAKKTPKKYQIDFLHREPKLKEIHLHEKNFSSLIKPRGRYVYVQFSNNESFSFKNTDPMVIFNSEIIPFPNFSFLLIRII